ncbi:uncharacterized protein Z519_06877 [Cladophialophora bantiana CBS 173.52]|uniref:CID domain-containing protein n=1 Tax=Cladophialophora bantiana (strain ATCC 10958 / CBS 173.52 / CDC B-1940 / NIH 8579) TaxID=1442370 RepID=A0A0D2HIE9_CLAB1|nr:uncharacterized protein Z519_06877 [Cladophialophora bantiana CBS 173.52]KIW93028.1 hypothetical protein Z519_06877 [Cladophialophora bantiana CBS 173.52]
MSGLPSDEVAEDYKNSLEDLVTNDRYQISNLTLIAKENTEHAEAISRVLQNHINRAPPARKLPALYVLDSIAKNVGSPYTVYFGRNLHQIFMLAYSQVDGAVRRKLEEMLKTWREPVPGALSTTPVFPIASTQTIVDSLNKFRGQLPSAHRHQPTPIQNQPARVPSAQPYRHTPTPPQTLPQFAPNIPSHIRSPQPQPAVPQQQYVQAPPATYSQPYPPQSTPTPYYQPPPPSHTPQYLPPAPQPPPVSGGAVDLQKLHADIDDLTTDAKIECATHPMDAGAQRKLASLQTLKEILDSGNASESDLVDIRNTIMQKMTEKMAISRQPVTQAPVPNIPLHAAYVPPQPLIQHIQVTAQGSTPGPPPTALFNSTNLAELLRTTLGQQQAVQPPSYYPPSQSGVSTPQYTTAAPPPPTENPLIAQLRASGLLSAAPTPPPGVTPPMASFSTLTPDATAEVKLTSASIRIPRPQMISIFLNARPNQCSTCGRRFTSDEAGKEKKAGHLDWHFKTKARMLEAEKRGQNRSWYVDEREWIASREYDDDAGPVDSNGHAINGGGVAEKKKPQDFVRVPADPVMRSLPCPIDQEAFKSEWSEEVQDFIWKDAVQVGGRYYHSSCLGDYSTSILGKRKAEEDNMPVAPEKKLLIT